MRKLSLLFVILMLGFVLASCEYFPTNDPITDPVVDPVNTPVNIESFDRLFNDEMKKSVTIEITDEQWTALNDSLISYAEQFGGDLRADTYVRANMIFTDDLGSVTIDDIGLRTRGNLSRVLIENSDGSLNMSNFKISFDEDFGLDTLSQNKKRTAFELEELDMKFNRNWDSTYLTEKFSLGLFQDFGVYAATTTLSNLYIKIGDTMHYYGVYTLFEPIDELFLKRRMSDAQAEGNLYKCLWQQFSPASLQDTYQSIEIGKKDVDTNYRPTYDLKTNKKTNDTSDLVSFIQSINTLEGSAFVDYIDTYFNVDMFLRELAVGVLLGNPDDYRAMANNYYLYHDDLTNHFMMIPYDYDHGMAQGWTAESVFSNYTVGMDIYQWGNVNRHLLGVDSFAHPLSDKILGVTKYQLTYEAYLAELINPDNDLFDYTSFLMMYNTQRGFYDTMVDDAMLNLRFDLRNIEWYMTAKISDIQDQLTYYQDHPSERGYQ